MDIEINLDELKTEQDQISEQLMHPGKMSPSDLAKQSKRLSELTDLIGKAEQAGTGVRNMYATCHDIGLDPPVIEENDKPE